MVNTVWVNGDHATDVNSILALADYMTKLRNFTNGEIREFSAF